MSFSHPTLLEFVLKVLTATVLVVAISGLGRLITGIAPDSWELFLLAIVVWSSLTVELNKPT